MITTDFRVAKKVAQVVWDGGWYFPNPFNAFMQLQVAYYLYSSYHSIPLCMQSQDPFRPNGTLLR